MQVAAWLAEDRMICRRRGVGRFRNPGAAARMPMNISKREYQMSQSSSTVKRGYRLELHVIGNL